MVVPGIQVQCSLLLPCRGLSFPKQPHLRSLPYTQFWTHAHQNTYNPTFFFNWKNFAKKTKLNFKTQKKSNFGGLYSPKVREYRGKIARFVYLGFSLYSQKKNNNYCMPQYFLRPTEQTSINIYSSQHMTKQVEVLYTHIYTQTLQICYSTNLT